MAPVSSKPAAAEKKATPSKKRKAEAVTNGAAATDGAAAAAGPSAKKAKSPPPSAAASSKQPLSEEQVARAVKALCTHLEGRKANDLLDEGVDPVHLQIALTRMPKGRGEGLGPKKLKPDILRVPHPARTLGECEVCLFTKDPQREYKDKLSSQGVERVKVIGVSKLKKKYVEYEAKRNLCGDYDVFLSDSRVLPMLPKLIGKTFFKKSKQPAAVDLTRKNLREQLRQAVEGARFLAPSGTLCSVTTGFAQQPQPHLVANVMDVARQAVAKLDGGWKGVQALYIKSTDTVALPIYQKPVA